MPPLPNVPNVLKTIIRGFTTAATDLPWANILHFAYSGGPPSVADLVAFATYVNGQWGTHMSPEQPAPNVQNMCEVIDLTSPTSASAAAATSNPGTRGDDEIPSNVAFLVNYPIARRYRGGHPRSYLIVGGNADFLDGAHWSSAFTAEVGTHWEAFLNAIVGHVQGTTTITNLVNVSYYDKELNPTPPYRRTTPITDTISVSGLIPEQEIATQRRRVGRHRA